MVDPWALRFRHCSVVFLALTIVNVLQALFGLRLVDSFGRKGGGFS